MSKDIDTKTIYFLEDHCDIFKDHDEKIDDLRRFSNFVWDQESSDPPPNIVCGKGLKYKKRWFSFYCDDDNTIVLSRSQRNKVVLLHELAHALAGTNAGHGKRFIKVYFNLLSKYMRKDIGVLHLLYKTVRIALKE